MAAWAVRNVDPTGGDVSAAVRGWLVVIGRLKADADVTHLKIRGWPPQIAPPGEALTYRGGIREGMTALDHEVSEEDLDVLRAAIPPEWREEPLGEEGVAAWESAHGLRLPEPFRTFVAEISNGSALGPPEDGGLLPLGWLTPGWPDQGERVPSVPFPLQEAWPWEGQDLTDDDGERIVDVFNHGSVVLGTDDELSYWALVVTGPQRGRVWLLTEVGAYPYPHPAPEALTFVEWVQHWKTHEGWWA